MMQAVNLIEQIDDHAEYLLKKDLREAAVTMSEREVRFVVDIYYQLQEFRKATSNIVRSVTDPEKETEPHALTAWLMDRIEMIEKQVPKFMRSWAEKRRAGRWALSQHGIGPVLAAGVLAHFDIRKAPTAGHFWRFAGLDPTLRWITTDEASAMLKQYSSETLEGAVRAVCAELGRDQETWLRLCHTKEGEMTRKSAIKGLARRPYNLKAKVLCWKIGQSFMKQSFRDECIYGKVYRERKALELARDNAGHNKGRIVRTGDGVKTVDNAPLFILDAQARRYAVKLFLSHLHHVMYECEYGEPPPKPYILTKPEHTQFIAPPGWPCE